MRYILFNVSRLNKVLISRWWITKAVPHHISPLWAINNVQHRYDTYQAGDQSFIHSKPLRRTKRHVGEILCRAVSLSTSLVKIYCGALWLPCEWWGTQLQSGTWQPNEVSPVLPPFIGSGSWKRAMLATVKTTPVIEPSAGHIRKEFLSTADHEQGMIAFVTSERCLAIVDAPLIFVVFKAPESQTSIDRWHRVAECLAEFNEHICQNKALLLMSGYIVFSQPHQSHCYVEVWLSYLIWSRAVKHVAQGTEQTHQGVQFGPREVKSSVSKFAAFPGQMYF